MDVDIDPWRGAPTTRRGRYKGSLLATCRNIGYPVVCYTHKKNLEELEELKKEYSLDNLTIKLLELKDFKYHNELQRVRYESPEQLESNGRGSEILWGKFQCIEQELDDEEVYWVDAGLTHPGIFTWGKSVLWNTSEKQSPSDAHTRYESFDYPDFFNRKTIDNIRKISTDKLFFITSTSPQCACSFSEYGVVKYPMSSPYIIGGIWGGNLELMKFFVKKFWYYCERLLENNLICTEEAVMKVIFDELNKNQKTFFNFDVWANNIDHDDFHYKPWNPRLPKPFYRVIEEINEL